MRLFFYLLQFKVGEMSEKAQVQVLDAKLFYQSISIIVSLFMLIYQVAQCLRPQILIFVSTKSERF